MEENFQVVSASVSDRGLSEKRPQNEDSYLDLTQHGIFAVADGVGGAQAGDVASQMAVEILGEAFANKPENADAEDVMRIAIERANSAIYQMSHDLPQLATMATTIVALHLSGNIATIGHVGDSRAYRVDSGGKISQETDDHSVVAEEVRAGRMTQEQAAVHPSRNVISRALGAEATVDIDIKTIMVEPDTSFILCSDGITRHIDDWELESILQTGTDLGEVCQKLKQICYERGAEDNLTAVIVKVKDGVGTPAEEAVPLQIDEAEEETVATARSPFDDVAEPIVVPEVQAEVPPRSAEPIVTGEPAASNIVTLTPEVIEPVEQTETPEPEPVEMEGPDEESVEPALVEPVVPVAASIAPSETVKPTYQHYVESEPAVRGSFFGSFVSSLLFLIIGGLVGAAGMYFLFPPRIVDQQQQPAPVLVPKSDNPPLTAFEESRRRVDADPTAYLEANKAYEPDADAADFYLKGRALLRLGLYFEAKQALNEAKKRLKPTDMDSATLNTEIALALAVIGSIPASESLRKDLTDFAHAAPANIASNPNGASSNTVAGTVISNAANQKINSNR
jgi:serine/threonine protein phosphatase PrpC